MDARVRLSQRGLLSLFIVTIVLLLPAPSSAQTANDPVEKLRQTLRATDNLFDRDEQTKACLADLHTLSQLRKAVVLREWRHHNANAEVAAVDQLNRAALGERFRLKTHQVLSGTDTGTTLATLEMLAETATSMRAIGEPATLTRPLTADVTRLIGEADPAVRAAAVRTLGRIDPDTAIALPVLIVLARSTEPARRIDAASALGEMLQATAQPWTAKDFNPTLLTDRHVTAESAAKMLPLAGACALDPNRDVRRQSLTTLALAATLLERLIPPVRTELRDPNEIRSLTLALQDQMKSVTRCVRDPETDVKLLALKVLEETAKARLRWLQQASASAQPGDKPDDPLSVGLAAALPALAETLDDKDVAVQRATLDVLETYGPLASAAAPAVALALKDPDRYVRWAAVRTLGAIGPAARPAIPALSRLMQDPDSDVRQAAAGVLQILDPKGEGPPKQPNQPDGTASRSSLPALQHTLSHDKDVEMRLTALHALAAMGDHAKPALPLIAASVRDADSRVRLAAVQALGAIGPAAKTVADALRQALKDDDAAVRKAASEALLTLEREP